MIARASVVIANHRASVELLSVIESLSRHREIERALCSATSCRETRRGSFVGSWSPICLGLAFTRLASNSCVTRNNGPAWRRVRWMERLKVCILHRKTHKGGSRARRRTADHPDFVVADKLPQRACSSSFAARTTANES
jgi:hypothetical protein